jgi:hypothetical protein
MSFDMLYWFQTMVGAIVEFLGVLMQGMGVFLERWGETAQTDAGFFWVSFVSVILFVGMAIGIRILIVEVEGAWSNGFFEGVEEIVQMEYEERLDRYVGRSV